jgi:hypothetical protein
MPWQHCRRVVPRPSPENDPSGVGVFRRSIEAEKPAAGASKAADRKKPAKQSRLSAARKGKQTAREDN